MLIIYQIKVGLCLIAFYLLWKLLLSRETFHRFNRVALLVVMALALVIPWVKLSLETTAPVTQQMVILEELLVSPNGAVAQQAAPSWSVTGIATVLYLIGMVVAVVWFLHGQWSLHRLLKRGRRESLPGGATLHIIPGNQTPFSYFKHIVINEQDYRDNPREILTHEQAHIDLRHSWDVLFLGLVTLFQWWNPAAWLLSRELRQVHEYEADEAVLNQGVDVKQYQLLLIRKSVGNQLFSMANNFNYQSLKKRIRMMVAAVVTTNGQQNRAVQSTMQSPVAVERNAEAQVTNESNPQSETIYKSVEQMPMFPGGEAGLLRYLQENIQYPPEAAKNNVQGRVILQFVVDKTGQVGEVKILRSVSEEIDAEAVRVVKSLPKFEPGRQDGEAVSVWYTLPVSFNIRSSAEVPQQNP